MDFTGFVQRPIDEVLREKGMVYAYCFELGLSAMGESGEEAGQKLVNLVYDHLKISNEVGIIPFHEIDSERLEELMGYCKDHGQMPERLPDVVRQFDDCQIRFRAYDLTRGKIPDVSL